MSRKSALNLVLNLGLLAAILLELLAGYWILELSGETKIFGFALHLLAVIVFSVILSKITIHNQYLDRNLIFVTWLFGLTLPVYGIVGAWCLYLGLRLITVERVSYFDVDESFISKRYQFFLKDVDRNIISVKSDELDVEAFRDIFKSSDQQLQINAINKLSKILDRRAVSILRQVVRENQSDIKIMAASALIEMEGRIIKKIDAMKSKLETRPDDLDAVLELARIYDLYCYLDIVDAAVKRHYQGLALEQYEHFLAHQPDHPEGNLEYGRALIAFGKFKEAVPILKRASWLSPRNPSPLIWLAEAFYELTDYRAVSDVCRDLNGLKDIPDRLKDIADWWQAEELSLADQAVE